MSSSVEQQALPASTDVAPSLNLSLTGTDISGRAMVAWCSHTCGCGHRSGAKRREIGTHTGLSGHQAGFTTSWTACRTHEHSAMHAKCSPGCAYYDSNHPRENREPKKRERDAKIQAISKMAQDDANGSSAKRMKAAAAVSDPIFPDDLSDDDHVANASTDSTQATTPDMAIATLAASALAVGSPAIASQLPPNT